MLYDQVVPQLAESTPKYRQIYDSLKDSIAGGQYRTGDRLPSESELVRTFSASRLTVNRALRELQLAGFIERRVGSGSYVSTTRAPGLTFGLLIPELGVTEIFEPVCRGMAEVELADHHVLLWGKSPDGQSVEARARELCQQWVAKKVSGVFFAPLELSGDNELINGRITEMLQQSSFAVVLLDRDLVPFPQRSRYDLVGIDNRRAAYVLTMHLVDRGCKRVVFVGKHRSAPSCVARAVGFREAVWDAGLPFKSDHIRHSAVPTDHDEVRQLLRTYKPDGIVCANDYTAAQLMRTLESLGVRVPRDVKIAGFDDVKYASLLQVPLTTIHQPCAELGAAAVRLMVDRLNNPALPPRDLLLDFTLVVRSSTGSE
ncbi:MAG: GntR family transcriptional regulator [Acidobacteria bacterium]|nr:MAG: GntR family transcriptional regulator [Acidobacteriota bacterium]